jgi:hypothetical protein
VTRIAGRLANAPVAALLLDRAARPSLGDLETLGHTTRAFRITHADGDQTVSGNAELLRDGLTFDCHGLAPAAALRMDTPLETITLPDNFATGDHALVTIGPAPDLAGAAQLLPVVRVLSGLVIALSELPGMRAVTWLPARLAMSPDWFAQAVGIWLKGGPFPALALTALVRSEQGYASRGLAYFVGQEFVFSGKDGILREVDVRGALRLTDWLVAHGRVDVPQEVDLPGFGTVLIEPESDNSLRARGL